MAVRSSNSLPKLKLLCDLYYARMASIAEAAHQGRPGGDQAAMQRLWPDLLLHDGAHLCAPPRARAAIGGVSDVSRTHHLSISSGQNP
jgi:hypothetical protein